jgi:FtsP/CotA-like multicopper oxidase with cupredoxin domain
MRQPTTKSLIERLAPAAAVATLSLLAATAHAAVPGITGTGGTAASFDLTAQPAYLNQPDGQSVYSWGYGCNTAPAASQFVGVKNNAACPTMQIPGPTLVVTEGQIVTVTLTNGLPTPAGNTSILFAGFQVCAGTIAPASVTSTNPAGTCTPTANNGVSGLLTQEAAPGGSVKYQFVATNPGTHSYYSGTQGDLQIEMGLYGAVVVLPNNAPSVCGSLGSTTTGLPALNPGGNAQARAHWGEADFRLATAAYDHPATCYDREYLFQFAEMDPNIHKAALSQVTTLQAGGSCVPGGPAAACGLEVPTEPYHPAYFLINGRSMPDDMDPNYGGEYPHQPYNGNPHMHPGEMVLLRIIGQGRWQHPFHEHANHVRILARDANLILSKSNILYQTGVSSTTSAPALAGAPLFTTTTTPGQTMDGIFYFTGRGLNWDMFGHNPSSSDALATLPCTPDANGYNTSAPTAVNYYEWCADHNKPLEANPFGDVPSGGPATLPNPNIFANGAWYSGSPYFGPDATLRADTTLRNDPGGTKGLSGCVTGIAGNTPNCSNLQPANTQGNPANERGWAFMWHSHNEREITTNNVFPGGMFMMMLVDSREFVIDESM